MTIRSRPGRSAAIRPQMATRAWQLVATLGMLACAFTARAAGQQSDSGTATVPGDSGAEGGPIPMTLAEAIQGALAVQPAMIQARGLRRNAAAEERTAYGGFLPTVNASATRNQASANRFNQTTNQIVAGGTTSKSYTGGLSLSLDLFDGFRRFATVRAADAAGTAADASLTNQRYQVTLQTTQLFYDARAREELVAVAEAQVARATRQFQISVQKMHAGSATRSDSLRSRVELGNARLALLQAQATLETARGNLARQVGVERAVRAMPDSAFPDLPDTMSLRSEALHSAPQVLQAEAQARAAGARVAVAH